jgi:cation diffusion facilitator CzcD-associated flavoprotein CzcO
MAEPAKIDTSGSYCIIGVGASGLAVAKTFLQRGIPFNCLEREADIGGLWNISTQSGIVYETAHLISSISSTGYDDLPMLDEDYPEYPSHERVLEYFRDYVETFGLAEHIEFGKTVERVGSRADKLWEVHVAGEVRPRVYRGVVIASGHHDVPRIPDYPGTFTGEVMHSRQYKRTSQLRDKRILVVGCGNSAADIVTDAVHGSSEVFLSIRRGYWFVPKFLMGFPTGDVVANVELLPLPRLAKRWFFQAALWLLQGPPSRYRMPDPEHAIDQAHPTMTDEIPRLVAHGSLAVKSEIGGFDGNRVLFRDGSAETVDLIIYATGYEPVVPFMDSNTFFDKHGMPRLWLNIFHPEYEELFAVGLVQANGSMWRLADYQAQLIANTIVAKARAPAKARRFFSSLSSGRVRIPQRSYVASDRHRLEVNYYDYRRLLRRLNRSFGSVRKMKLAPDDAKTATKMSARALRPMAEPERASDTP